jgi:hypothetical protein
MASMQAASGFDGAVPRLCVSRAFFVLCISGVICGARVQGAELQPKTVAAFDRYVKATEARITTEQADGGPFLHGRLDTAKLRAGELAIDRVETREQNREIEIPDGIVHHWVGTVFVPGVTVGQAVALLQDYDRHAAIYAPNVARSKLVSKNGDEFRVYLRFYMKKVLTVVVNSDHDARFHFPAPDRAASRIISTRIAEVEDPDTKREREKPVGNDGGYLWRLNSYWRFLERDGGTYVQCESISLTRGIPFLVKYVVGPFVNSIPRETLTFTLETTRKTLAALQRRAK